MQINDKLAEITKVLLAEEIDYQKIKSAVDEYYELFKSITEFDENKEESRSDIFLDTGKAIAPLWAAMCIKEMMRTKRFVQGFFKAVKTAQLIFAGQKINILYAGTGPFAALFLPLTTQFSSNEISVTMLEINPESIKTLEKVIDILGIKDYISEIVQCDAAAYKASRPIHIIVTEVMQNALKREPQVSVTLNLAPQLQKGGILIPEQITVDAALIKFAGPDMNVQNLGKIFELTKDTTHEATQRISTVSLPEKIPKGFERLYLLTNIKVFGEYHLGINECSLTLPLKTAPLKDGARSLDFKYVINEKPGFEIEYK